jgi:hypothetical protein
MFLHRVSPRFMTVKSIVVVQGSTNFSNFAMTELDEMFGCQPSTGRDARCTEQRQLASDLYRGCSAHEHFANANLHHNNP